MELEGKKVISLTVNDLKEIIQRFKEEENMIEERTLYANDTVLKVMRETIFENQHLTSGGKS